MSAKSKELLNFPVEEWLVKQVIVFDWYNFPKSGVCQLSKPQYDLTFDIFADNLSEGNPLFTIGILPDNSIQQILNILANHWKPKTPIWIPEWVFEEKTTASKVNKQVEDILSQAIPTDLLIMSQTFLSFQGVWQMHVT